MTWTERYLDGQRVQVWTEMTALGASVRADEETEAQTRSVVSETMNRARSNVEYLVEELPKFGYEFDDPEGQPPFEPAAADTAAMLDDVEALIGPIPLSLRGWYELVGRVNLVGRFPEIGYEYTDPLVVDAPIDFLRSEHAQWVADRDTEWDQGPFAIGIGPDWLHKADVSGGPPYSIELPCNGADALLLWEPHMTTFVNYLRIAFSWSGFPGWDRSEEQRATSPAPTPEVLRELQAGILPI